MRLGARILRSLVLVPMLSFATETPEAAGKMDYTSGIDFGCAEEVSLPDSVHVFLEDRIQKEGRLGVANWLDRAARSDLNGDGAGEYLIPYDCGGTGFCIWALFDGATLQHLGNLEAAVIYLTPPRKKQWPPVETFFRNGDTEAWVATYQSRGSRYTRGSWSRLFDPTGTGAIRRYLSSRPAVDCPSPPGASTP